MPSFRLPPDQKRQRAAGLFEKNIVEKIHIIIEELEVEKLMKSQEGWLQKDMEDRNTTKVIMTKEKYLDMIRNLDAQVEDCILKREHIKQKMTLYTSSKCGGRETEDGRKEPYYVKLLANISKIDTDLDRLDNVERDFTERVSELEDNREQTVMTRHYLFGETQKDISQSMYVHPKTVSRLLKSALKHFKFPEYVSL